MAKSTTGIKTEKSRQIKQKFFLCFFGALSKKKMLNKKSNKVHLASV